MEKIIVSWADEEGSCYRFFRFLEFMAFNVYEMVFEFKNSSIILNGMDASRIMVIEAELDVEMTPKVFPPQRIAFNLEDFRNKVETKSKRCKLELRFVKDPYWVVEIRKIDKKTTSSTLNAIDLETESIPMENLKQIEYPTIFKVKPFIIEEIFKKAIAFSEILTIGADDNLVSFSSYGQIGHMEYSIPTRDLKGDSPSFSVSSYSLSFLMSLKGGKYQKGRSTRKANFLDVFEDDDEIKFELKTDHPLKMTLRVRKLGLKAIWFLAPRVEEADYFEDDYGLSDTAKGVLRMIQNKRIINGRELSLNVPTIEYNGGDGVYYFMNLINYLRKNIDEGKFVFSKEKMSLLSINDSKTMLMSITKDLDISYPERIERGVVLEDLWKVLVTKKAFKRNLRIEFGKSFFKIIETRRNDRTKIETILDTIDMESGVDSEMVDILEEKKYGISFQISEEILEDIWYETGVFSDVSEIIADKKGLRFRESGQIGFGEYFIPYDELISYERKRNVSSAYKIELLKSGINEAIKGLGSDNFWISLPQDDLMKLEIYDDKLDMDFLIYLANWEEDW